MNNMKKLSNLNRETKIFFVILFFAFFLGIALIQESPFFSSVFLGYSTGALFGVIYLYEIGRLEIFKGKKYKWKRGRIIAFSKNVSIKIKGYFFFLPLPLICIAVAVSPMENLLITFFFIFCSSGATLSFVYFINSRRVDLYKQKKDKGVSP
ncbi:MAG: hypothetical protein U9N35_09055 [Euryarchaeota archaeon]|nr:hypothetical protein [Euryarchaeota archaeon]